MLCKCDALKNIDLLSVSPYTIYNTEQLCLFWVQSILFLCFIHRKRTQKRHKCIL